MRRHRSAVNAEFILSESKGPVLRIIQSVEPHFILLRGGPVRPDVSGEALAKSERVEGYELNYFNTPFPHQVIFCWFLPHCVKQKALREHPI
jgi:hypothetical protein